MTTGQRIRAARKKAGMTQAELAKRLGISYVGISQWENDIRNPKYETLLRIAKALNVEVDTLYTDREKEISTWSDIEGWCRAINYYEMPAPENTYMSKVNEILSALRKNGYTLSENEKNFIRMFSKLNSEGQERAIGTVEILSEIPRYQKEPETPPQAPQHKKGDTTPEE